ncbi:proline and serine-rich protein 2 [Ahaetulla prasina]|uniref:proline and serine-rich protein 2 n=1 Tax=Ahaetulla prasina TaxID=499056 RepID=UPI00264984D1|nr:proline and serine-rich protein 2 [Ahaetulla prasina]XP_058047090.1 proline and serine-rich protein 2 [Ahaetulla prasina]
MPRNMVSDYSGMGYEIPSEVQFGNLEKTHHLESGKSCPDRKHSILDEDERLKELTHEEKDVLLFFEETIDSLDDDMEEEGLHDSGVFCSSPKLVEENTPDHPESEELIELVPSAPENSTEPASEETWKPDEPKLEDVEPSEEDVHVNPVSLQPTPPPPPPLPVCEVYPFQPTVLHPKLLHSIPTPLLIAEKLSERKAEGSSSLLPAPKERSPNTRRALSTSSTLCSWEQVKPCAPPPTAPKPQRFPSNISFTNASEREFNKTISKAAVNVQERKAQVLANVNASALLMNELEERLQKRGLLGPSQSLPLRDLPSESMGHEPLSSLSLVEKTLARAHLVHPLHVLSVKDERSEQGCGAPNGYQNIHEIMKRDPNLLPNLNKTMTLKPDADFVDGKSAWPSISGQPQQDLILDMQRKLSSLPKSGGLQSKGITVQFSGRGSTEKARREALQKLGLLKE